MFYQLFRKHLLRPFNFNRYHKQWAVGLVAYTVISSLSAIQYQADGSWGGITFLFYLALAAMLIGGLEILFILFGHYKSVERKCAAVSRSLSCFGVVLTIMLMCGLYQHSVYY